MKQIIKIGGKESKLYSTIAPLTMNAYILRQNNNYPFKTSSSYVWFVLYESNQVIAFMPVEHRDTGFKIDNYYASASPRMREEHLKMLLQEVISSLGLQAMYNATVHIRDKGVFTSCGFTVLRELKHYVRMSLKHPITTNNEKKP